MLAVENRYKKNIFFFSSVTIFILAACASVLTTVVLDSIWKKSRRRWSENERKSGHEKCVCTEMEAIGELNANKIYDIPNLYMIYNAM